MAKTTNDNSGSGRGVIVIDLVGDDDEDQTGFGNLVDSEPQKEDNVERRQRISSIPYPTLQIVPIESKHEHNQR